ncbi:hypothetical protein NPX13_g9774 [Xylaria arbuscula]|uniref:Uncharacterized protein n=1 Tax=Xylaria arbuscula TaxID=114810 RepID=A0A9W8N625_9PEZI|nr:hypothetical protein NPX13_g9774 [Xylaria arbuscula]
MMAPSSMQNSADGSFPKLLPAELKLSILRFALSNSAQDLINLTSSCRLMYQTFSQNRRHVFQDILGELDNRELAIATAHYHATIAPWTYSRDLFVPISQDREDYLHKVTGFCEKYLARQGTELGVPLQEFTIPMAVDIRELHLDIAAIANTLAPDIVYDGIPSRKPSSIELAKISKCLYIISISLILFPRTPAPSYEDYAFAKFWSCFAPWESWQAVELENMLNRLISQAPSINNIQVYNLHGYPERPFLARQGLQKLTPWICDSVVSGDNLRVRREVVDWRREPPPTTDKEWCNRPVIPQYEQSVWGS